MNELETLEAELNKAEKCFRTLFENAGDVLFLIAPDGHFVDVNRRAFEALYYTREELIALGVPDIEPVFPAEKFSELFESLAPPKPTTVEAADQRKDGSTLRTKTKRGRRN